MKGYLRSDGRKGIRNVVVVAYLVECAHHAAREIAYGFRDREVHLIGFPGCFPNAYADRIMRGLTTHPNVGAALLVSLGCESFDHAGLAETIEATGRPVHTVVIQESGGTAPSIREGREWIEQTLSSLDSMPTAETNVSDLVVGVICGGSDATSGLTANPAVGRASDLLIEQGATVIFEETGELIGCEQFMADRAASEELGREIIACVEKAARYYTVFGHSSFAPGNADGGLTTIEEKSLGAYSKSGKSTISGLIKPGDIPPRGGLYLMDVVPDGEPRFGFPNISDNAEIVEMIASGAHLTLFTTGRGSVVGSAISPVIKVCANPDTFRRMGEDMDVNAGRILEENATLDDVGREIVDKIVQTAAGRPTCSEALGHQEFILTYKTFEPIGPGCLPGATR
ncbi:MAG: UxaA family hydrolase [Planctomycetaceae bacterium]|nr:UxaA family hydrolase [Planctomycetaceae bacterium]